METISVHASRDYEVRIGSGLLTRTGELSAPLIKGRHAMIVSDSNVWPLYGAMVQASLEDAGFQVDHFVFPAGEQSKNTDTLVQLLTCLAQKGMTRSDGVFALGGGVTGDMAGLAASLYLRGIPCVQLPTSLLSVVDSSVGGKTAVDLPEGKNLVGTFTQPHLVLCDTNVLATLSPQVEAEGWAEIIKYGMIRSQELINFLLENTPGTDIEWVIAHCVSIKRDVVAQDEQDNAVRQVLNFGHTIGHAIERCGGYSHLPRGGGGHGHGHHDPGLCAAEEVPPRLLDGAGDFAGQISPAQDHGQVHRRAAGGRPRGQEAPWGCYHPDPARGAGPVRALSHQL